MLSQRAAATLLTPDSYRRTPWKNGGGVTIDIAGEWRDGAGEWSGMIWRFGRTAIVAPGPFSDLSGYDRAQMVARGDGLVLVAPDATIDLREPLRPARFAGETPIMSRLENGPVEVLNLIGDRAEVEIDLVALRNGQDCVIDADVCIVYAFDGQAAAEAAGSTVVLDPDHALRIAPASGRLLCRDGVLAAALIRKRAGAALA